MHRARVWLVVALVLAAGCNGTTGQPTASRTVSPAPVPTAAPTTAASYPPGLTADGVSEASALASAHEAALNTSYVLVANRTVRSPNGSVLARRAIRVRLGPDHERFHARLVVRGPLATHEFGTPPIRAEFWSDGERYLQAVDGNGSRYGTYTPTISYDGGYVIGTGEYWVTIVAPGGQPHQDIAPLFDALAVRIAGRSVANGGTRYRIEADGLRRVGPLERVETAGSIRNVTFVATVDRRGLVRSYRLDYLGRAYGRRVRVTRTVRYASVGTTTVRRPDWYDRAVASGAAGPATETGFQPSGPTPD